MSCGVPGCSTQPCVKGLATICAITCGDSTCIGVGDGKEYLNPDARVIQQTNETPNAFPTKVTLDISKFKPVLADIVREINRHCSDNKFEKWLGVDSKVTVKDIQPSFEDYCTTRTFKNTAKDKHPCLLLAKKKGVSLQNRFVQMHLIAKKRDGKRRKAVENNNKPGKKETKRALDKKKYHEDEEWRDNHLKNKRERRRSEASARRSEALALAEKNDIATLEPSDLTSIAAASCALLDVSAVLSPNDNFAANELDNTFK